MTHELTAELGEQDLAGKELDFLPVKRVSAGVQKMMEWYKHLTVLKFAGV
jgi:hypothetical protein